MSGYFEDLYIENLFKNSGFEKQLTSIKELGKLHSKLAIPKLREICFNHDNNLTLRINAILSLAEIGDRTFIKHFLPLIKNEDPEIIEVLVIAIGKLKATEFISELESFINFKSKDIKIAILETLDKINDELSIKLLIKFYSDFDSEIKELIKFYLQKSTTFNDLAQTMSDNEILNILTLIPLNRASDLIKKLINTTKDETILRIVIRAIGDLKIENSIELLKLIFYRDISKNTKISIIEAMEKIDEFDKKDFFKELITYSDRDIKTKALMSLGKCANELEIIEIMKAQILDKDEWWLSKKIAIIALSNSSFNSKVDFLVSALQIETDSRVIKTLIQEIGESESSVYINTIKGYLNSGDLDVQKSAMFALSKLGDKSVLEFLLKNRDARESLLPESLKAMINFNDTRMEDILIEILKMRKNDDSMLNIALDGLSLMHSQNIKHILIYILMDNGYKREFRAKVIMLLASYKDNSVVNTIEAILKNSEEWWMIKKLALILCKEIEAFSLLDIVVDYAAELDDRLSKTARETAKYFYNNYFLNAFKDTNSEVYKIAEKYSKLL